MIYFHFPILSPISRTAAEYSECVGEQGQEPYWDYLDGVYHVQGSLSDQSLKDLASSLDIDSDAVEQCVASGRHTTTWQLDLAFGQSLGANSTPTIIVAFVDTNGEVVGLPLVGARDYATMSGILNSMLAEITLPE